MDELNDRLVDLYSFDILDTPAEAEFDLIVQEASESMGAPIALISLLDEHRQWFKAKIGIDASETPLASSFCTHAIRGGGVYEVQDARADPLFRANPLVTGDPKIRFYAGAPLKTRKGTRIGTLCVIDRKPRPKLREEQRRQLVALADRVIATLESRARRNLPIHLLHLNEHEDQTGGAALR